MLTKTNSGILQTLEQTVAELCKHCLESEDNSRFLNTLERHFLVSFFPQISIHNELHQRDFHPLCVHINPSTFAPQNLATGAEFAVILETIPPLMDSLQIIWMLSCHYNTDERLAPLMERIAWQLCERVCQIIDIHKLFKYETHFNFYLLQIVLMPNKFDSVINKMLSVLPNPDLGGLLCNTNQI